MDDTHFHIKWRNKDDLDWQCFESHEEALSRAEELAFSGEDYSIERVCIDCPLRRTRGNPIN
jgi:hypothetical protein